MPHTAETWPIAAALLQFPGLRPDGSSVQDDPADAWLRTLREVRSVGFDHLDLTDSWLRIGDLSTARLAKFEQALAEAGLRVPSLSITRRSVADPETGADNLAYAHRTIDAAAALGVSVLSVGFHRPLTDEQRGRLWFWTSPGAGDDLDDPAARDLAVARIRELGTHAAENDMVVSLEMYEDTYLGTADGAVSFVQDVDRDNVGLDPDIGNLVRLHRPIEDWREMLTKTLPHTNYWQVKNYYRDEDPATGVVTAIPAPLELGLIDYRWALREALAVGFDGVLCCEHYGGDGLGVSARNQDYVRGVLTSLLDLDLPSEPSPTPGSPS